MKMLACSAGSLTRKAWFGMMTAGAVMSSSVVSAQDIALFKIVDISLIADALDGFTEAVSAEMPDATFQTYDAQGQPNLFPTIARQIVRDKPDLIAVIGTPVVLATVQAAQQAGSDVPIVFIAMGDPVGSGLAASLEKPGGQATGTTDWVSPTATIGTIQQALPELKKIGTIWDPANQNGKVFHDEIAKAVDAAGLELVDVSIGSPGEVFVASKSLSGRADAIVIGPDAAILQGLPAVGSAALDSKIPLFITAGEIETPGVLASLGVNYGELGALSGKQAVAILGGKAPGDIAIVGPDGVTIQVNEETLGALGMTLPADFGETDE